MGIWIRSQDKEKLINVNEHLVVDYTEYGMDKETQLDSVKYAIWGDDVKLGIYSTKEKALKVLDMIEKKIIESNIIVCDTKDWAQYVGTIKNVFQMPQDEEME